MGRFLPPDHSKGDERTVGGYMAVHARPAAFEGVDGASYSVEIEVDETGDSAKPFGAYLLFVRWTPGEPRISGHLETDLLTHAATADEAQTKLGAYSLEQVKAILDALIRERWSSATVQERPWWEVMHEEDDA